jgi:hypothetical protein
LALEVNKGSFSTITTTGTQSVTGVGFQPDAVIFWGTSLTAAGYGTGLASSFGVATSSTARWAIGTFSANAAATSACGRRNTTARCIIFIADSAGSIESEAQFNSADADGFTLDWINAPGSAWLIHYLAIGGTTVTGAKAGVFNSSGSTGAQAVTGVGFEPDFLLLASELSGVDSTNIHNLFGFGMASSSSARAALAIRDRSGETTTTNGAIQVSDAVFIALNSTGTVGRRADLTSFDSDGFTLNWSTASAASIGYLALAGGTYKVGVETQNTTTGTKATTGVGAQPAGLFIAGTNRAASASEDTTQMRLSVGGGDGTTEGGTWVQSADNAADSDTDSRTYTDKAIGFSTQASTTNAEADISAFGSDGFTLDWTTADATAREFIYAAFGEPAAAVATPRMLALTGVGT